MISIGQVVPHEVIGMANFTKNVVIGLGGAPTIHRSHFVGAVAGMEQIMGRSDERRCATSSTRRSTGSSSRWCRCCGSSR